MESWEDNEDNEENEIMKLFCWETHQEPSDFEREASILFKLELGGVKDENFSDFLLKFLEAHDHIISNEPKSRERLKFCQTLISKVVNDEKKIEERIYFPESKKAVNLPRIVFLTTDYTKGSFREISDHMVTYLSLRKEDQFPHFIGFHFAIDKVEMVWIKGQKLSEETVMFSDVEWTRRTFQYVKRDLSHNEPLSPQIYSEIHKLYFVMEFIKKVVHA